MLTLTADQLIFQIELPTRLMHRHVDDLSDEEACVSPLEGDSANWILGHLLVSRDEVSQMLGAERQFDEALHARYGGGSQPVTAPAANVPPLSRLRQMWDEFEPHLKRYVRAATPETFTQEITRANGSKTTLGGRIAFYLLFHEGFHIGQFEYARHAVGKHESMI
jgi:hypothetical protein